MEGRLRIAAIGGGPAALFLLQELTKQTEQNIALTIFEKGERLGAGMPYSNAGARTEHLANVSGNELPDLPQTVEAWMATRAHTTPLSQKFQEQYSAYRVLPRLVLGDYLADQFQILISTAKRKGMQVDIQLRTCVVDIRDKTGSVAVFAEDGTCLTFDRVVICTGHQWPKENEGKINGYFDSPYPPSKLAAIGDAHPVAIRGASLTAFDALRTLARRFGRFTTLPDGTIHYIHDEGKDAFRMVMHTRNGFLPAVRVHLEDPHFAHQGMLTKEEISAHIDANDGFLSLDYIFEHDFKARFYGKDDAFYRRIQPMNLEAFVEEMLSLREKLDPFVLLKAEYAEAEKSIRTRTSVYWKELLGALSFALNYPAKYFSAEDTARLHKSLLPLISVVIAFVPQPTARELLALHSAGALDMVVVGNDSEVVPQQEGGILYKYVTEEGIRKEDFYQTFVDAVGQQHFAYEAFPFRSLLDSGTVTPATVRYREKNKNERMRLAGIAINDYFQVVDEYGAPNTGIYVVAVPLIGGYNPDYSGLDFCEAAARAVVKGMCLIGDLRDHAIENKIVEG